MPKKGSESLPSTLPKRSATLSDRYAVIVINLLIQLDLASSKSENIHIVETKMSLYVGLQTRSL